MIGHITPTRRLREQLALQGVFIRLSRPRFRRLGLSDRRQADSQRSELGLDHIKPLANVFDFYRVRREAQTRRGTFDV